MNIAWRSLPSDRQTLDGLASRFAPLLARVDQPELDLDVAWLAGLADERRSVQVWALERDGELAGYAPFFIQPSSLDYRIGEITLFGRRCRRYVLTAEPVMAGNEANYEDRVADLFAAVAPALPRNGVVYLQGVRSGSAFHSTVLGHPLIRRLFHVVPLSAAAPHRLIELSGDFQWYLAGLSKATRKDLRRTRRRIQEEHPEIRTRQFSALEDVETLLRDVERVSRRTYQWHVLEEGVAASPLQVRRLSHAALLGILRSYVLYLADRPIAFRLGYAYRGTYFSHNVGYDPEFAHLHVGMYLFTETVADLLSRGDVARYDFLYGDAPHKQRLSNAARVEQHLYLMPRTPIWTLAALSFRCLNSASGRMGALLERYDLKQRTKKLVRNLTLKRSVISDDSP
jgi:hypothetical protein